jgi:hypothetical protein
MAVFSFNELLEPFPKQREIMDATLAVEPNRVKQINLCCGLGFSKTVTAIQIAVLTLNYDGRQRVLFLEPDWDRLDTIFWPEWQRIVPEELYTVEKGNIVWYNGSVLYPRPRVITGSKERSQDKYRGIELTAVIDDETAIGYDDTQRKNILARIRRKSDIRYYLTLSTPKPGAYARLLKTKGMMLFRGRTRDNIYLPENYEADLRRSMSKDEARRELDGELVALEGRIWKDADMENAWPRGTINNRWNKFNPREPWWLFCDFGSQFGAYVAIQKMEVDRFDHDPNVWVAVADYCPNDGSNAVRAFHKMDLHFGPPVAVVGGRDVNKESDTDGKTIAYMAGQTWPGVHVLPCDESNSSRQIQFNVLSYLFCSANDERRFTIAKDFISLADDSYRGVREMIDEDAWPPADKRTIGQLLPKDKTNVVQHVRDALLNGAAKVLSPPDWRGNEQPR